MRKSANTIGFIGLGNMGLAMASRLSASGVPLCVYDINTASCQSLESDNTLIAKHPSQIAEQCELVFLCLPDECVVESVLFDDNGLLSTTNSNLNIVLDTSTLDVERTRFIANQINSTSNVHYCDCPVTGLPARAKSGELTAMFGGPKASFDSAKCFISHFASNVLYCGDVGQGQLTKAFNNVIYDINIAAFCELLPLAVKSGLDPSMLEQVLNNGSATSFASKHFLSRILDRQFTGDFSLQGAYKDLVNVGVAQQSVQASTPLFDAMKSHYEKSLAAGFGDEPKSAMVKLYEQSLDVTVKR